ncbi:glycosyltransferase family 28 C-terminal domain-domain-containing protein [Naematelia encephala]|uniref:UDP-N-acetylglucosamine transferase subunit ALG13 n=1 Tax=Naematelia encephala TaxID=71784 RepID=A0A1Y2AJ10_9TREE|nr:glycosyltransferase family 28 C-terminal domain-domain-containing protein [Naematelia encephala]
MSTKPSSSDPTSLLITVGSTLFPELTSAVLTRAFARILVDAGIKRLVVQYGKAKLPWELIMRLDLAVDALGQAERTVRPFDSDDGEDEREIHFQVKRFVDDFDGVVASVDAVISHAGSGSIMTALRNGKKLLVVPNTSLMDNHQAELADVLNAQGYLTVSSVDELYKAVPGWLALQDRLREFPQQDPTIFRRVVDEVAGF